jgi:hypothetical protein
MQRRVIEPSSPAPSRGLGRGYDIAWRHLRKPGRCSEPTVERAECRSPEVPVLIDRQAEQEAAAVHAGMIMILG